MSDLSELSKSYYSEADIYETFSRNEDHPHRIYDELLPLIKNRRVLDLGCGNGKYIDLFYQDATFIIGVDKSSDQINRIQSRPNVSLYCADAQQIPLQTNYVDVILSCWMLGTILDSEKQNKVLKEMKRVLQPNGKIILVENDEGGEFEELRGRSPDPLKRTFNYNQWLLNNGFKVHKKIETYFQFNHSEQANFIFESIWKDKMTRKIKKAQVQHKVVIFVLENIKEMI